MSAIDSVSFEGKLRKLFQAAIASRVFPGAVVGIVQGCQETRKEKIFSFGNLIYEEKHRSMPSCSPGPMGKDVFFDLASLTKPLATVLAVLTLVKSKKISLDNSLSSLLERKVPAHLQSVTLAHLLGHCSGLPAHRPYYELLGSVSLSEREERVREWVLEEKSEYLAGSKTVYSDLGYMLLNWIVECQGADSFGDYVKENVFGPISLSKELFFIPRNSTPPLVFAPTENCPWRHKILVGQVHDDNCYAMGGVVGHAGLFGNINGVLKIVSYLLDMWKGIKTHPNIDSVDFRNITKKQEMDTSWALGFDTPSPVGSSAGHYFSEKSFGHLGFTGTSFWVDPSAEVGIVLLTNRVHPSRDNNLIREFRPIFHDAVMENLVVAPV